MVKSLLVLALVLVSTYAMATPTVHNGRVTITYDRGGNVASYERAWRNIAQQGVPVVIAGECTSACTFVLGIVPPNRVCMTRNAKFGMHLGRNGRVPDYAGTRYLQQLYYPPVVRSWIAAHEPLHDAPKFMHPSDMRGFYRMC